MEFQHFESSGWFCLECCKWEAFGSPLGPHLFFLCCLCFFSCCMYSFFRVLFTFSFLYIFSPSLVLVGSQYHGWVFWLLPDLQQKLSKACYWLFWPIPTVRSWRSQWLSSDKKIHYHTEYCWWSLNKKWDCCFCVHTAGLIVLCFKFYPSVFFVVPNSEVLIWKSFIDLKEKI